MSYITKIKDIDLIKFDHGLEEYHQGWESCDQYAYNILTGKILANKHVKNACARYVHDRTTRTDLEFNTQKIQDVINFANKLNHTKGKLAGKPIYLMMWMVFVLGNMFGWYYIEGERKGERRYNKSLILVARGNAKSFLASIVGLYTLLTSPNGSPAVYSVARTAKQAGIVFNDAKKMVRSANQSINGYFSTKAYDILTPINDGEFRALASEAQSMDGLILSPL